MARADAARVAAILLAAPPAASQVLDVTGPQALTLTEVAQQLSVLVDRPLRYKAESGTAGQAWRSQLDVPAWEVATWLGSYEAIGAGELAATSPTVEALTGQAPQALAAYFATTPYLLDSLRIGVS